MGAPYDFVRMVASITSDEALARLPEERRRLIEEFRDRVRELLGERLRDLRLYGSAARGESHEESDIDLLVLVADGTRHDQADIAAMAYAISSLLHPYVAPFDWYHAPMNRATGFYAEVRRDSVRL